MLFEFLIPKRPLSSQTKNRPNLQKWKQFVRDEASKVWVGEPLLETSLHFFLVYLCDEAPADTDNIIKPIQDSLNKLVYNDDQQITDVESHRRSLIGTFDITRCPRLLYQGILSKQECVYVRICDAKPLEDYL